MNFTHTILTLNKFTVTLSNPNGGMSIVEFFERSDGRILIRRFSDCNLLTPSHHDFCMCVIQARLLWEQLMRDGGIRTW